MTLLRWIFGFPLATGISFGILYLSVEYGGRNAFHMPFFTYLYTTIIVTFCFAVWVFLTCFFIPFHKKYAGFAPVISSLVLIGFLLYTELKDGLSPRRFSAQFLLSLGFMTIGLFAGYFVSYQIFKGKGWGKRRPLSEIASLDI